MKLAKALNEIESWIAQKDLMNTTVSKVAIGWQIGHSLKVMNSVVKVMAKSDPKDYKWTFNLKRIVIMAIGVIPRSKAKAPHAVRPEEEELTTEALHELVAKVRTRLEEAAKGSPDAFFDHPYFGNLKRDAAFRFMGIHTEHHLKIVRDIAKKQQ